MNKKGVNYALFLVFTVIVCCVLLVIAMNNKFSLPQNLGDVQSSVLKLTGDMRMTEEYLARVSKFAINSALRDLPTRPEVGRGCYFGGFRAQIDFNNRQYDVYCPVVNNPERPADYCMPDLINAFQPVFNENLNVHIRRFNQRQNSVMPSIMVPEGGYEYMPFANDSAVIAAKPTDIIIRSKLGESMGHATFRPAFRNYQLPRGFFNSFYPMFEDHIKDISVWCHDSEDIEACIREFVHPVVPIKQIDDKYAIFIPYSDSLYCFAFNLPGA